MKISSHFLIKAAVAWLLTAMVVVAQPSAFTYQGSLSNAGSPANGNYDIQFDLKDAATFGATVGTVTVNPVTVTAGVFTVELDYGFAPAFIGFDRWLEISVRPSGSVDPYTVLAPRQPINSAPYANFAGGVNASSIIGQVTEANLAANVALESAANTFTAANTFSNALNQFHGDGSNLTDLDASNVSAGTLDDGRLSSNVALKDTVNTFSANQVFSGKVGIGTGITPAFPIDVQGSGGQRIRVFDTGTIFAGYLSKNSTREFFAGVQGAYETPNATSGYHIYDNTAGARRFVIDENGNTGIGASNPGSKLTVAGTIESTTGGVKFPDGTTQTTAATATYGSSTEYLNIGVGAFSSVSGTGQVANNWFYGVHLVGGPANEELVAPVQLPVGARILSVTAYVNDVVATDLRFALAMKLNNGPSMNGIGIDFILATSAGYANQTFTPASPHVVLGDRAYILRIVPIGGNWPLNGDLAIQKYVIAWDRP